MANYGDQDYDPVTKLGSLTNAGRLLKSDGDGTASEGQIEDSVSGGVLDLVATITAKRTLTLPDADLNLSQVTGGLAGADAAVLTGTAGSSGNAAEWNADGDLVDSGYALAAASAKGVTGSDAAAVTGTAGSSGQRAKWNGDGDLVAAEPGPVVSDGDVTTVTGNTTMTAASHKDKIVRVSGQSSSSTLTLDYSEWSVGDCVTVTVDWSESYNVTVDSESGQNIYTPHGKAQSVTMYPGDSWLFKLTESNVWEVRMSHHGPRVVVDAESDSGQSLTADTTKIEWEDENLDLFGEWDGDEFSPSVDGDCIFIAQVPVNGSPEGRLDFYNSSGLLKSSRWSTVNSCEHEIVLCYRCEAGETYHFRADFDGTCNSDEKIKTLVIVRI